MTDLLLQQVQRLQTVSTLERSQASLWWSWPVLLLLSILTCISGLGMYAVYKDCDPLLSHTITAVSTYIFAAPKSWIKFL